MPIEEASAFIIHIRKDKALQKTIQSLSGRTVLEEVCKLGEQGGYNFNEAEYREAIVLDADGELSDKAIEETMAEMNLKPKTEEHSAD